MPTDQVFPQKQRKSQAKVKERLTIYWKADERAQLHEILKELDVSLYRYLKDCVTHRTAFVQAIKHANTPQIWYTLRALMHEYGQFELNLNSIFATLREIISVEIPTTPAVHTDLEQKPHKSRPIPLLRPEQQRTVELAGAALGPELKDAFKAFKVLEAAADQETQASDSLSTD